MANYVSVDLGYGYVKAISSKGKKVIFPSLVGKGYEQRGLVDIFSNKKDDLKNIHVVYEGVDWFVGELANESSSISRIFERERFEHLYTHILLNVAIQLVTEGDPEPVYLSTGLPLDFYKSQAKDFQYSVTGLQPKVEWKSGALKGQVIQRNIEKAVVFPQGVAAIFSTLINHDGKKIYPEYMREGALVALVDIGFRTTDFVVVEMNVNGSFELKERLSGTVDEGAVNLHRDIRLTYRDKAGGTDLKENHLNRILKYEELPYRGKKIDFRETIETSKKAIVTNIVDRLKNVWGEESDLFDAIFLAGGGGELFEPYIQPQFGNRLILAKDSQFANAIGYLRLGKAVFDGIRK